MKRIIAILAFGFVTISGLTGCYTTGKATGEAAEGIERGADRFEKGYDEGKR